MWLRPSVLDHERRERVLSAGQTMTVGGWLEHWVETIAARKVRPSTLEGYRSKVRRRMVPALGHHRLDRLQPEHVEAFYGELLDEGLSTSTVLQVHRVLSRALKVAMQRGRVAPTSAPSSTRRAWSVPRSSH